MSLTLAGIETVVDIPEVASSPLGFRPDHQAPRSRSPLGRSPNRQGRRDHRPWLKPSDIVRLLLASIPKLGSDPRSDPTGGLPTTSHLLLPLLHLTSTIGLTARRRDQRSARSFAEHCRKKSFIRVPDGRILRPPSACLRTCPFNSDPPRGPASDDQNDRSTSRLGSLFRRRGARWFSCAERVR
jgi:hypothetical protein